jgi:hypothetical protein
MQYVNKTSKNKTEVLLESNKETDLEVCMPKQNFVLA